MGKKRGKNWSSREDDDVDLSGPSCRHIKKGTDQTLVKKLTGNADWTNCQDCKNEDKADADSSPPQDTERESGPIWMCLKCGHRGCGRSSEYKHAIKHYEIPRSDPHCLVVSLDNWAVWCYICDEEVQYSHTGHLAQLLTNLKKETSPETSKRPHQKIKEEEVSEVEQKLDPQESDNKDNKEKQKQQKKNTKKESMAKSNNVATQDNCGVSVKGLSNLGNTCFFNAVIQNLSQTQILRDILNKVTEEKMTLNIEPSASSNLEPVTIQLDRPGSLTLTMCQLLNEIQESKKSVVTPRDLFTQVCKRAVRFKGFQQQDSQELLRYLLDGIKAEEIKRVSSGLMDLLKESKKGTDEEQLKTLLKEYEKNAFPKNLVDQVFGGEMTSTLMCQQCKTVSVVTEMFLDLSLPVSDEAYSKKFQKKAPPKSKNTVQELSDSPALTNGSDDVPAGSKYQQKKAKKQAKKQAKQQKRQQKLDSKVTLDSLTSPERSIESTEHTAEIEHYKEEAHGEENPAQSSDANTDEKSPDTVQAEAESEDDEESITDCDSSVKNRFTLLSDEQQSNNSTFENKTSDTVQDLNEDSELVSDMKNVTLDEAFIEDSDASDHSLGRDEPLESKEYTVVKQDPELAFQTLATRTVPEKKECSVQSCLFQFTEVETLTQNNSLLCVTCTKQQHNKGKSRDSKNVYMGALKQMLISSLPPVLTLHLKRFQQNSFSICKVNRHVQFPMIMDLAPFCAVKCKNTTEGESQILYSLYGIVEHSGTMRSGHYTAYVKVRPQCPNSLSNGISAQGDTEAPKGSWFHISDTSVQPVTESKVQSCQAYLLFYERIL